MIVSFVSRETEDLFHDRRPKKLPADILRVARRKLLMLHAAKNLGDLRMPPGNRLEALGGNRKGQYSIRINDQWRICFHFENGQAKDVEITDYHR
ncbi:MAG: type II toxin-antitoxin system RelE/ParE family toxin [Deltaproteobacteria bacterium]|nr:type II toxin-antitoxin system RelE/ParE family toxin [Deltaproteobacteria bacterium]